MVGVTSTYQVLPYREHIGYKYHTKYVDVLCGQGNG